MLELIIQPRFCETDALGHINNAVFLEWFEQARIPLFKIFTPDLDPKKWRLIIARNEIDYLAQTGYEKNVTIKTYIEKIGNSSMHVIHEAFQNDTKVAAGKAVMIHFDYKTNKSVPIPAKEKSELSKFIQ